MSKDTLIASILWATAGFAVLYAVKPAVPLYNPLDGSWAMSFPEGVPAMSWYGRLAWAALGAAVAGGIRGIAGRFGSGPGHPAIDSALSGLVLTSCVLWLVYYEWQHWIAP